MGYKGGDPVPERVDERVREVLPGVCALGGGVDRPLSCCLTVSTDGFFSEPAGAGAEAAAAAAAAGSLVSGTSV